MVDIPKGGEEQINEGRRDFLGGLAVLGGAAVIGSTTIGVGEALAISPKENVQKSRRNVGNEEVDMFCHAFGISSHDDAAISNMIYKVQGSGADGIIGPNTLKHLYENYYFGGQMISRELEAFKNAIDGYERGDNHKEGNRQKYQELAKPLMQGGMGILAVTKMRYLIYREVKKAYRDNGSTDFNHYDSDKLFDNKYFFGDIGKPDDGKYMFHYDGALADHRLYGRVDFNSPEPLLRKLGKPTHHQTVAIVAPDSNGVFSFLYYEHGKLKFMFPCSPGSGKLGKTPSNGLKVSDYHDVSHFYFDDVYKKTRTLGTDGKKGGAMPLSRGLSKKGYYTHIGHVTGEPASHGCCRLPGFGAYAAFYEMDSGAPLYYSPREVIVA